MSWDYEAERDIWRAICSPNSWFDSEGNVTTHPKSIWWFVRVAWGAEFYLRKHPEQPYWLSEHIHVPYLEWLQTHLLRWQAYTKAGGTDRYHIASIIPRNFGKSVTTTKSAMLWLHLREPDMSTLICSGVTELAEDFYKAIKSVLSDENKDSWFSWLFGNWRKGATEWTKTTLKHAYRDSDNISEGSIDITSVDAGMTGYHHRIHCWDDPIIANKRRVGREAYDRSVHEAVNASYNAIQSNGLMALVLTRYYDDDVAGRHLRDEGIASWTGMDCPNTMMFDKIPMGEGIWHVYFLQTEDELTGEPTHPLLYDKKKIAEHKSRDPEDFACQQQNNPGTGERAALIESQLPDLFMDYKDFQFTVPIEAASIHLDTAFKTVKTIRTGDDNAIVPWLHDARRNGMIYLDTDLLMASNEWREEDFNTQLVRVFLSYRRRGIRVKALTDEKEPGGKAGTYKNRVLTILYSSGIPFSAENFKQFNRTTDKKARIRSNIGYWAEGYVRILLHKDIHGRWIIPPVVRKLFNQILRIDAVTHEDLADASVDVFNPSIWRRPVAPNAYGNQEEGSYPRRPGDEDLKSFSQPPTIEEIYEMIDANKEVKQYGPGRGWDADNPYDEYIPPRDPV